MNSLDLINIDQQISNNGIRDDLHILQLELYCNENFSGI